MSKWKCIKRRNLLRKYKLTSQRIYDQIHLLNLMRDDKEFCKGESIGGHCCYPDKSCENNCIVKVAPPSPRTKEEILKGIIPDKCSCHEIYKCRKKVDPDCVHCNYWDEMLSAMDEYVLPFIESAQLSEKSIDKLRLALNHVADMWQINATGQVKANALNMAEKSLKETL